MSHEKFKKTGCNFITDYFYLKNYEYFLISLPIHKIIKIIEIV